MSPKPEVDTRERPKTGRLELVSAAPAPAVRTLFILLVADTLPGALPWARKGPDEATPGSPPLGWPPVVLLRLCRAGSAEAGRTACFAAGAVGTVTAWVVG